MDSNGWHWQMDLSGTRSKKRDKEAEKYSTLKYSTLKYSMFKLFCIEIFHVFYIDIFFIWAGQEVRRVKRRLRNILHWNILSLNYSTSKYSWQVFAVSLFLDRWYSGGTCMYKIRQWIHLVKISLGSRVRFRQRLVLGKYGHI